MLEAELLPSSDPSCAQTLLHIAGIEREVGEHEAARESAWRAWELLEERPSHRLRVYARTQLARVEEAEGDHEEVIEHANVAEALFDRLDLPRLDRASNLQRLARAHVSLGEPEKARPFLNAAEALIEAAEPSPARNELSEQQRLLDARVDHR